MATPASFVATPEKRIAAFIYDFFAIFLGFLALAVAAKTADQDLGSFAAFISCAFAYHYWFLAFHGGRTLGKAQQDICVVSAQGNAPRQWQSLVRCATRYLPLLLLSVSTRDWILEEALLGLSIKIIAALVWLAEYSMLKSSPTRQTLADRFASTLVVNTPTWEPHRAPAIPMYSATDAEFGAPPKGPRESQDIRVAAPNPSIERTSPGKPGAASHVKC